MIIGVLNSEAQLRQLKSAEARRCDVNLDANDGGMQRFITEGDLDNLVDVLVDTDDSLRIGLSQIGIDPASYDNSDLSAIRQMLRKRGLRPVRGEGWVLSDESE